jgi:phosphoglycerol transferase MdoB-like AlkP superfamily enzyme
VTLTLLVSVWLNARYPQPASLASHFRLAIEVPVMLALLWVCQRVGIVLRWWAFVPLALVAVAARLFMTADAIAQRYLYRDFRFPLDLRLIPEFFRLMYDTSPAPALFGYAVALVGFLGISTFLIFLGSWSAWRRLARPSFRALTLGLGGLALVMMGATKFGAPRLYSDEVSQRISREAVAFRKLPAERREIEEGIAQISQRIGPGRRLDKLQNSNVMFVFVESYGGTSFTKPAFRKALLPRYHEMEQNLAREGFYVASNFVTSPTYGGFSWFAHSTLNTGFKVTSHLHYQLIEERDPKSLADYFREAGYRAIHVAPGTTRPWPGMDDSFGFNEHVFSWEFGYHGPTYSWATMADQFVFDYVQRKVLPTQGPLFLEFALVNSHAPFSDVPKYVEDWSRLGDGSMLNTEGRLNFNTQWEAGPAMDAGYAASIAYEMRVIEDFLIKFIKDDTLFIFVGDHQPMPAVTKPEALVWSVPMHIASRKPEFVAPFLRRGYHPGMVPDQPMPHVGMERFLEELLSDFSTEPLAVDPGVWAVTPPDDAEKPL